MLQSGTRIPLWRVIPLSFVLLGAATGLLAADNRADTEARLKEVRDRIKAVAAAIARDVERRNTLDAELRRADQAIQQARQRLDGVRRERAETQARLADLGRQQAATRHRIAAERDSLAREVRTAYMNGRQERLKLILTQEDPATLGRMLVYYGYFSEARAVRIAAIKDQLAELERIAGEIEAQNEALVELESRRAAESRQLEQAQTARRATLAALDNSIKSREDEATRLKSQAQDLERLLAELERAAQDFPALGKEPFAATRGRLPWPVKGKVLARFGQLRAGGPLKWQGILIGAPRGAEVRAPHFGRVIYADWLPGMGLLLVLDHGNGYLSLYGHNEQLFRAVGDRVAPGDVIATVGDSGGNVHEGLYVEIRKGRQPLDPLGWLRKP